ncbi:hypothetical protein GCM10009128_13570 [Psychrosphaera haliotis]|uniref:hypothetical protein n=1 Tax=Psychrosphaera haliotis TaxID=555083 RepID=UPI0031D8A05F
MATFLKVGLALLGILLILSMLPTYYVNVEGLSHWSNVGGVTENLIGFAVVLLIFFGLAVALISLFAGLFVVFAMIVGAIVLAGLSAVWPLILFGIIGYLIFFRKRKNT